MKLKELGSFEVVSGEVRITDPCYDIDTWCTGSLKAENGKWNSHIFLKDEGDLGIRVSELWAIREGVKSVNFKDMINSNIDVGVDSGQAGIFDINAYQNLDIIPNDWSKEIINKDYVTKYLCRDNKFRSYKELEEWNLELLREGNKEARIKAIKSIKSNLKDIYKNNKTIEDIQSEFRDDITREYLFKLWLSPFYLEVNKLDDKEYLEEMSKENPDFDKVSKIEFKFQKKEYEYTKKIITKSDLEEWYDIPSAITLSKDSAGVMYGGVVSRTGYGDGSYDCYYSKNDNDEAIAIRIKYI